MTEKRGISSFGRASGSQSEGNGFDSRILHREGLTNGSGPFLCPDEYGGNVAGKQFDGHSQQDDSEELPQHIDDVGPQPMGDFVKVAQDEEVDDDVGGQANHDVDGLVLGMERDEGRDGSRSGNEGEGDGDDACTRRGGFVLDDVAPEYHLEGEDEEHHGAGHSEGGHVDAEEVQQGVAEEVEADEEHQGGGGGLQGFDLRPFLAHGHKDGDGTRDVDDGEHDEEGAENLYEADGL